MPFGKPIPLKDAGRVMEQIVQIVVPRGSQGPSSYRAGVDAYDPDYWYNKSKQGSDSSSSDSTTDQKKK